MEWKLCILVWDQWRRTMWEYGGECLHTCVCHVLRVNKILSKIWRYSFFQPSGELQVSTVFSTTASEQQQQHSHSVNASLCFLTEQLCLFTNGSGSLLLLDTTDRSRSINQPPSWNVIVDVTPRQLEGIPLIIQCTALASIGLTLDVGLLQLKYTASIGHSGRTNKPSICIFHCYRINFSTLCSRLVLYHCFSQLRVHYYTSTHSSSSHSHSVNASLCFLTEQPLCCCQET